MKSNRMSDVLVPGLMALHQRLYGELDVARLGSNLPILLAGHGGGTLRPGRHLRFAAETPLANLWVSMHDRMDTTVERRGKGPVAARG